MNTSSGQNNRSFLAVSAGLFFALLLLAASCGNSPVGAVNGAGDDENLDQVGPVGTICTRNDECAVNEFCNVPFGDSSGICASYADGDDETEYEAIGPNSDGREIIVSASTRLS